MASRSFVWLLWLLSTLVFFTLVENIAYLLAAFVVASVVGFFSKVDLRSPFFYCLLFGSPLFFINLTLVRGGRHVLYTLPDSLYALGFDIPLFIISGPYTFEGVYKAFFYLLLLVDMFLYFTLFNRMSDSDELIRSLSFFASSSALLTALVLRFIPTIKSDSELIRDAQRSRGLKLDSGGIRSKIRYANAISLPLIVCSLERSLNIAESIEARGFSSKRTNFFKKQWSLPDKAMALVIVSNIILMAYLKFNGVYDIPSMEDFHSINILATASVLSFAIILK
jgi:energy-coupling factor transport system permease protein